MNTYDIRLMANIAMQELPYTYPVHGDTLRRIADHIDQEQVTIDALRTENDALRAELAAVKQERDAVMADMEVARCCDICKHSHEHDDDCHEHKDYENGLCFEWRGVVEKGEYTMARKETVRQYGGEPPDDLAYLRWRGAGGTHE